MSYGVCWRLSVSTWHDSGSCSHCVTKGGAQHSVHVWRCSYCGGSLTAFSALGYASVAAMTAAGLSFCSQSDCWLIVLWVPSSASETNIWPKAWNSDRVMRTQSGHEDHQAPWQQASSAGASWWSSPDSVHSISEGDDGRASSSLSCAAWHWWSRSRVLTQWKTSCLSLYCLPCAAFHLIEWMRCAGGLSCENCSLTVIFASCATRTKFLPHQLAHFPYSGSTPSRSNSMGLSIQSIALYP